MDSNDVRRLRRASLLYDTLRNHLVNPFSDIPESALVPVHSGEIVLTLDLATLLARHPRTPLATIALVVKVLPEPECQNPYCVASTLPDEPPCNHSVDSLAKFPLFLSLLNRRDLTGEMLHRLTIAQHATMTPATRKEICRLIVSHKETPAEALHSIAYREPADYVILEGIKYHPNSTLEDSVLAALLCPSPQKGESEIAEGFRNRII